MLKEVTSRPTMQEIVSWPEREGPGSRGLGATTQEIVEEIRAQRQRRVLALSLTHQLLSRDWRAKDVPPCGQEG